VLAYLKQHHVALLALFVALGGTSLAATRSSERTATIAAYGYYPAAQPCISQAHVACPASLIVASRLVPAVGVRLTDPGKAAGAGFVCLALTSPRPAAVRPVLVASPATGPHGEPASAIDHAEWIPAAPNCPHGQLEVDTYYVLVDASGQHVIRAGLPFAFTVAAPG
jgi:hypothetical protein